MLGLLYFSAVPQLPAAVPLSVPLLACLAE